MDTPNANPSHPVYTQRAQAPKFTDLIPDKKAVLKP